MAETFTLAAALGTPGATEVLGGVTDFTGGHFLVWHPGHTNLLHHFICQANFYRGSTLIPEGVQFWLLDSGVIHNWGERHYNISHCAAEAGSRMLQQFLPHAMEGVDGGHYLANIGSDRWRAVRNLIPETMTGREILQQGGEGIVSLDLEQSYKVRLAAEHHIYEAERAERFDLLLGSAYWNPAARHALLRAAGDLLIQSHFSLDHRCQLAAPETDLLMNLAREVGPERGVYGARVTGRGAGGRVAVMTDAAQNPGVGVEIESIASIYEQRTGNKCRVSGGPSNDGCIPS